MSVQWALGATPALRGKPPRRFDDVSCRLRFTVVLLRAVHSCRGRAVDKQVPVCPAGREPICETNVIAFTSADIRPDRSTATLGVIPATQSGVGN